MKKEFCRKFFQQAPHDVNDCTQCKETWEEIQREENILSQIQPPLYHKTNEQKAALDHNGRP